tara:strand:- start:307 stop:753 length:447 start_codon:yes stop_codon:yes gene_type:complete
LLALIQKVSKASVEINTAEISRIKEGLVIFVCAIENDNESICQKLAKKILNLRIFEDSNGKLNKSLIDVEGHALVISQFTLAADLKGGNRPSFSRAAPTHQANILIEKLVQIFKKSPIYTTTGKFGSNMKVNLTNNGPITVWLNTEDF